MNNYPDNKHAIYGMMSKRDVFIDDDDKNVSYHLVKNNSKKVVLLPKKDKIISFEDIVQYFKTNPGVNKIKVNYVTKSNIDNLIVQFRRNKVKYSKSHSTLLVSEFDSSFFDLRGKNLREFRETKNSLSKHFTYKVNESPEVLLPQVNELIEWWDKVHGPKYGWQRHSGYDKTFFDKTYPEKKDNFICLSFYDISTDKFIGYSVMSSNIQINDNKPIATYIIRKCNTEKRNTTMFIDLTTFEWIYDRLLHKQGKLYVNWGASSKGVLKYKEKFPCHDKSKVYFCSVTREGCYD